MANEAENRYEEFADEEIIADNAIEKPELTTLERMVEQFGKKVLSTSSRLGEATAIVEAKSIVKIMTWLRDEAGFVLLSDLTAHDCSGKKPRFSVIYQLTNMDVPERLRIKAGVTEKKPVIESVTSLWPGANYMEREVYDLFGIEFKKHPNLKRILMPLEWEGHPLRKDYPEVYEEVQFTHNAAEVAARKPFARRP